MSSLHPLMADVIRTHFTRPRPVVEPPYRDEADDLELTAVAMAATLRDELHTRLGDKLAVEVALPIARALLDTYCDARMALIRQRSER